MVQENELNQSKQILRLRYYVITIKGFCDVKETWRMSCPWGKSSTHSWYCAIRQSNVDHFLRKPYFVSANKWCDSRSCISRVIIFLRARDYTGNFAGFGKIPAGKRFRNRREDQRFKVYTSWQGRCKNLATGYVYTCDFSVISLWKRGGVTTASSSWGTFLKVYARESAISWPECMITPSTWSDGIEVSLDEGRAFSTILHHCFTGVFFSFTSKLRL